MKFSKLGRSILLRFPYVRALHKENRYAKYPPGHYYSPIVATQAVKDRQEAIWKGADVDGVAGVDLRTGSQLELLAQLAAFYPDVPFTTQKRQGYRYYFGNDFYSYTDGFVLHAMIRHLSPRRIIEIGSGFSSAVMLDTNQYYFENGIALTFIDPYADRLFSLITEADRASTTVIEKDVQLLPLSLFETLEQGDILFVDSTHVSKTGSDVNYILFEILPRLKKGVFIHFHDVFYPFEYPKQWVFNGFNWNEDYLLRAFLMYNDKFRIALFSEYLHQLHPDTFSAMPMLRENFGGNLWIEKT